MPWGTLTLVAGPNGAGKTTLVRGLKAAGELAEHVVLNADDYTLARIREMGFPEFAAAPADVLKDCFIQSAEEVYREMVSLLEAGEKVCVETVLSTDKYRQIVATLQTHGGMFELVYVALQSPKISGNRVAVRVQKGGHDVPASKLAERWKRSLEELRWFARKANRLSVFDNSSYPLRQVAEGGNGQIAWTVPLETVFPEIRTALQDAFENFP